MSRAAGLFLSSEKSLAEWAAGMADGVAKRAARVAIPMSMRRTSGSEIARTSGDAGYSSSAEQAPFD
jgi:hypothetical protein